MLRTLLALALLGCAHALIAAPLAARPLAARAAEPMTMKHKDYFKRLKRSEDGRLRLCVSRCVGSPPRERDGYGGAKGGCRGGRPQFCGAAASPRTWTRTAATVRPPNASAA